ncbi:T9SS type B sorting domain-containing protein [Hymenobacter gummosus]|uniref:T9SS type B sorting domain-containing protein n=1 Tax=Hymenobacter gummosus TaxID=1776032 RepID=A0A431U4N3_9BACT|nr:gliding motility-associated C-terminal domain-containing protein [Hymenobacter gummosus]RTQ50897.1 T9SS type B sorting domain-containing protein [Hymenobacter gummosus]
MLHRYSYCFIGWLSLLLLLVRPAAATHLVGGEMSYQYLGNNGPANAPYHYLITATVYFSKEPNSVAPDGRPTLMFSVVDKDPVRGSQRWLTVTRNSFYEMSPLQPSGCSLVFPRVTVANYSADLYVPASTSGYVLVYSESARNIDITNLFSAGSTAMGLSVHLPPMPIVNTAPVFSDMAVALICQNDTTFILNNAYDADGDRLEYSFGTPYSGGTGAGMGSVNYNTGFSVQQPFGPAGYTAINPATGLASYFATQAGRYVVAVDVREYRTIGGQEVLLNTIRRDMQLVVRPCGLTSTRAPSLTAATLATRSYTIEEGQDVGFDITAQLPGQPLTLRVSSILLDGPGPFDAAFNNSTGTPNAGTVGAVTVSGTGTVSGRFRFRAGCGTARPAPYDVVVLAQNNSCGGRNVAEIFQIRVTRAAGPTGLSGPSSGCGYLTGRYETQGPSSPSYGWRIRGGRIIGPTNGAAVQVEWGAGPSGRLTAYGLSALGCPTDSVTQPVTLTPGLPISGAAVYCPQAGRGMRFSVPAQPGSNYQWSIDNGGSVVSGQGTAEVQVNVPNGRTATLRVLDVAGGSCPGQLLISPDQACLAFYNVITPNGDGLNDAFVVEHLEYHPGSRLRIYSRWGRELYQTADYRNDWRGDAQPAGIYYYLLQVPDGRTFKGWFELLR